MLIITTNKRRQARELHIVTHAIELATEAISAVVGYYSKHWQEDHLKTDKDRKVIADFTAELTDIIESARVESV